MKDILIQYLQTLYGEEIVDIDTEIKSITIYFKKGKSRTGKD